MYMHLWVHIYIYMYIYIPSAYIYICLKVSICKSHVQLPLFMRPEPGSHNNAINCYSNSFVGFDFSLFSMCRGVTSLSNSSSHVRQPAVTDAVYRLKGTKQVM